MRLGRFKQRPYPALAATVAFGLFLLVLRPLTWLSYDLSYLARAVNPSTITNLAVVRADGDSMNLYNNGHNEIARRRHAELIDRLREARSGAVFYDFLFATNRNTEEDQALAAAIKAHGAVFLAAAGDDRVTGEVGVRAVYRPAPSFCGAAVNWGHAVLIGNIIREIPGDWGVVPYGPWVMATNLQPAKFAAQSPNATRWLNFYDLPYLTSIPQYTFQQVLSGEVPLSAFSNKFVFVGHGFPTAKQSASPEMYPIPYLPLNRQKIAGVLIHATAFLNLWRDDWLREVPLPGEVLGVCIWAVVSVFGLYRLCGKSRPVLVVTAVAAAAALCAISVCAQWYTHWWWSWAGPAGGQTALAICLLWSYRPPLRYLVFINYRRNDAQGHAGRLYGALVHRFGEKSIFMDRTDIKPGDAWRPAIQNALENSQIILAVIGPDWFSIRAEDGVLRLDQEDDYVRSELRFAFAHKKEVLAVLVGDGQLPAQVKVPEDIEDLFETQKSVLSADHYDRDVDQLAELIIKPRART